MQHDMIDRLRHSMRALQMLMRSQEVTANNLANINTPGFKSDKLFYRAFREKLDGESVQGVETRQSISMQQGTLEATNNPLDFAIEGEGFFQVSNGTGTFLTRNGRFSLNPEGYLVDSNNSMVEGVSGAIHLPQFAGSGADREVTIEVAKDGTVKVEGEEVARIKVVNVDDLPGLERRTNSYLAVPEGLEMYEENSAQIVQGYYEAGNVNPLSEMVDMTRNMRLFESQQRAMRTSDEMLSQTTTKLGRF
ncbi:flagellar basal-body rod protein FlgF/flagellar basal-body rod protein FlgG [Fodinibius sediminis]|uniref:Flagellar basal-body rod protein FlgF/flagellar basal-body rod protein FlgG n=2 Tax=Fodinibius sediminis TaxID=1214077 RepID=A0A521CHM8_9BACT|nr:flagellar basal-body rod protein FlgF/flagellar basal-body rod protein FlgG [Fodinibius sediminis]